ncbi:MAG: hypothetical protein LH624_11895 [Cryobacterium sp.]|nr:hypothetical protein [Cryobacterium sp.]
MSLPIVRAAEEAVSLMRATQALGLETGVGDADKPYWANSTTERLHVKEKLEATGRVVLRCPARPALDPSP